MSVIGVGGALGGPGASRRSRPGAVIARLFWRCGSTAGSRHHRNTGDGRPVMPGAAPSLHIGPPAGLNWGQEGKKRGVCLGTSPVLAPALPVAPKGGEPNRALPCQAEASGEGRKPSLRMGAASTVSKVSFGGKTVNAGGRIVAGSLVFTAASRLVALTGFSRFPYRCMVFYYGIRENGETDRLRPLVRPGGPCPPFL